MSQRTLSSGCGHGSITALRSSCKRILYTYDIIYIYLFICIYSLSLSFSLSLSIYICIYIYIYSLHIYYIYIYICIFVFCNLHTWSRSRGQLVEDRRRYRGSTKEPERSCTVLRLDKGLTIKSTTTRGYVGCHRTS